LIGSASFAFKVVEFAKLGKNELYEITEVTAMKLAFRECPGREIDTYTNVISPSIF
jgi:hypothetical protein